MAQVQAQAQAQASDAYRLQVGHNYVNDTHFLPYQKKKKKLFKLLFFFFSG
jgi:hypothetical protein